MNFLENADWMPVSSASLNSLGMPRRHCCSRCGIDHRIAWQNIRYRNGVVSIGKTLCVCGDEVVSIWAESMDLAAQYAETFAKQNPIRAKKIKR